MATQSRLSDEVRPATSRVWSWVFFWFIFCVCVLAIVILANKMKLYILLAPLFLWGLVLLVNEARGVALSDAAISFPLRIFRAFPLLTWGRKAVPFDDIYHAEIFKDCDIQKLIVTTTQLKRFGIYFPGAGERNTFLLAARDRNPGFGIIETILPAGLMTYRPLMIGLDIAFALAVALLFSAPHILNTNTLADNQASISKKSGGSSRPKSADADVETYMLHAASYDWARTSRKKVEKFLDDMQRCAGVPLQITTNSEYKFFNPVKKWFISAGPFKENEANIAKKKLISCGATDLKIKEAEVEE